MIFFRLDTVFIPSEIMITIFRLDTVFTLSQDHIIPFGHGVHLI